LTLDLRIPTVQRSYRVRGVEGSCAKHLTMEFHTVVVLLTFILIIISIPSVPHSFNSRLKAQLAFYDPNWIIISNGYIRNLLVEKINLQTSQLMYTS